MVVSDADGNMTKIEKPSTPISKRANIGLYDQPSRSTRASTGPFASLKNKGEDITDAFQNMIEHGAKIRVIDVEGWDDAGEQGTLLETNRAMLERAGHAGDPARRRQTRASSIRCTSRTMCT